ncbi:MAG: hypothetical protein OEZ45_10745 [Candidatus Aminicenantes bacterium]|nr:hypothetical protein [Candidatus Aminicenantes bacterium]
MSTRHDFILYLVESGVCLAFFYIVYWIFLKKETFFNLNRLFLVSSIGLSLIIPLIRISAPITSRALFERTYPAGPPPASQTASLGVSDVLLLIYFTGVGFLLLRFGFKLLLVFLMIRRNGVQKYNGLKVVFIERSCSPFSFFNYVFVNRSNVSDDDFQRIISHEMIHIKQYHSLDLIILELITIYQWFNPFVWPYKGSLKETHEYLADDAVIAQGCSAAKYQLLIFEQHVGAKLFEFANNFNQSQIKRRITMLTRGKSKRWAKLKMLTMLPIICLLVFAFADSKAAATSSQASQDNADAIFLAPEEGRSPVLDDQKKAEDQKKKEKLMEIEKAVQELKMKYEKTDDPALKKKIKEKITVLAEEREKLMGNPNPGWAEMDELKKLYEKTDDPEKKKEIKMKIAELEHKKQMEETKKIDAAITELKKKYEQTDDPELKEQIKQKIEQLKKQKK